MASRSNANRAAMAAAQRRYYHPANRPARRLLPPPRAAALAAVGAVTEVIGSGAVTSDELQAFAELIATAITNATEPAQLAEQVEATTPKFASLTSYIQENWLAILAVLVAILAFVQDYNTAHKPDPAPTVVIMPPDPAQIERIVDERIDQLEREAAEEPTHKTLQDKDESADCVKHPHADGNW